MEIDYRRIRVDYSITRSMIYLFAFMSFYSFSSIHLLKCVFVYVQQDHMSQPRVFTKDKAHAENLILAAHVAGPHTHRTMIRVADGTVHDHDSHFASIIA